MISMYFQVIDILFEEYPYVCKNQVMTKWTEEEGYRKKKRFMNCKRCKSYKANGVPVITFQNSN